MTKIHLRKFVIVSKKGLYIKALFLLAALMITSQLNANSSDTIKQFLNQSFDHQMPKPKRLWIDKEKQAFIKTKFNPSQIKLSYRYWRDDKKTVWILDEVGKERNITTGIVIENNAIRKVQVLVYRESRGGQVQNNRFTDQYNQKNSQANFIKEIDSISGATLSVNALNKQVKLALWLNKNLNK